MSSVKEFYDMLQFPGHYTVQALSMHFDCVLNPYLATIDAEISAGAQVLDVGCGTGLISNLLAVRHTDCLFTGIDFADSIEYANEFAKSNNINNVNFIKQDINTLGTDQVYDVVICQGVLHHIPNHQDIIEKLKDLVKPGGKLIIGLYHPWGKIAKRFITVNYNSNILYTDQELHPFECAFTVNEVKSMCKPLTFKLAYPSLINTFIAPLSLFKFKNGGLVTYVFEKL